MFPLIRISDTLVIPTYYLILSGAVCLALLWVSRRSVLFGLSRQRALDLSLIIMVSGFIGGRLFHVFYENYDFYLEDPTRVLYFWNGGFVFYGGALLSGLCAFIYLRATEPKDLKRYLDLFAAPLSFTYILGRIACFFAGCCYGRYCDLPWAINARHPTQLYAVFWEVGTLILVLAIEKTAIKDRFKPLKGTGSVFYLWILLHACGRLVMEAFRDDFRGPTLGLSISSWISVGLVALAVWLLSLNKEDQKH